MKKHDSSQYINNIEENLPFWLIIAIFTGATMIFFRAQLFEGYYFWTGLYSDFAEMHLPRQMFAAKYLRDFSLPFWNPYTFGGMPFLAEPEVGFFYPPTIIMNLLSLPGHLPVMELQLAIMFHFLLAGISMYLFVHLITKNQMAGIISGLSYAFSAIFALHFLDYIVLYPIAWLPLVMFFLYRSLDTLHVRNALYGGFVLGISMLAGHMQSVLYMFLFFGMFIFWCALHQLYKKNFVPRYWLHFWGITIIFLSVGIGLFAIQLLHSHELAAESTRSIMTYEKAVEASVDPKQLLTAVVPKLFGHLDGFDPDIPFFIAPNSASYYYYWATAFYFGITALILGIVGAVHNYKNYLGGFFIFTGWLAILYALGEHSFVFKLFFNLPPFNLFRGPSRILFLLVFSMSVLAGFGYVAIRKYFVSLREISLISCVPLIIAFLVTSGYLHNLLHVPLQYRNAIEGYGLYALFISLFSAAILFLMLNKSIHPFVGGILLCLLIIIDLNVFGSSFKNGKDDPENGYQISPDALSKLRSKPPSDIFRISGREGYIFALKRNHGLYSGIMQIEGEDPLNLRKRIPPAPTSQDVIDLMNIRYSFLGDTSSHMAFFQLNNPKYPHSRLLYSARVLQEDSISNVMRSGKVDFGKEVVLEKMNTDFVLPVNAKVPFSHSLECKEYSDNRMVYFVTTEENAILLVDEIWYPAWKAKIDGTSTEVLRANYCFRAVTVPKGTHTIKFYYESEAFIRGAWITIGTFVLFLAGIIVTTIQEKKSLSEK
ncbi:MAG: YfhO family protein [Bacteroidota bacterium]